MKQYPSIPGTIVGIDVIAFDKLDGSNIRCEWTRKNGLHKFGSRKVLLGEDHPFLGRAIDLTMAKYADPLNAIFRAERFEFTTCFFEFHGARSFAGLHEADDPTLTTTLLDVDVYKRGQLPPREFLRLFADHVETPAVLHEGKPNADFIRAVKESTLAGMTYEGVVCKGLPTKKGFPPKMFKVKSNAWIEAVKARYGNDPAMLTELL